MGNKPQEMLANEIASSAAAAVRVGEEDCFRGSERYLRSSGPEHEPATDTAGEPGRGYRSFFENAVEGMYRTTLDGRYLDVNPALARMHGCETPEAFIGHFRNASVRTYVDPASREELVRQMRDQGCVRGLESEAYRRNGTRFWISVTGHRLWNDEGHGAPNSDFGNGPRRRRPSRPMGPSCRRPRAWAPTPISASSCGPACPSRLSIGL